MADLPERFGRQQRGRRPVAVLADAKVGLVAIAPLTSQLDARRFHHTVLVEQSSKNGLDTDSVAMIFQIASIDARFLVHQIGVLEPEQIELIDRKLRVFLKL